MEEIKEKPKAKVLLGAKVPVDVRDKIKEKARQEQRSISQIVSRLLSSHPEIKSDILAVNP